MVFLSNFNKITDTKYEVGYIHNMPFDPVYGLNKTQEELQSIGVLLDSLPEAENNGMNPTLYINPSANEVWYEYTEFGKTQEQIIIDLQAENSNLKNQVDALNIAMANIMGV